MRAPRRGHLHSARAARGSRGPRVGPAGRADSGSPAGLAGRRGRGRAGAVEVVRRRRLGEYKSPNICPAVESEWSDLAKGPGPGRLPLDEEKRFHLGGQIRLYMVIIIIISSPLNH